MYDDWLPCEAAAALARVLGLLLHLEKMVLYSTDVFVVGSEGWEESDEGLVMPWSRVFC